MTDATNIPRRAAGKTGTTCPQPGPYTSGDNGVIIFLRKGDPFPPDVEGHPTTWTLVGEGQRLNQGRLVTEFLIALAVACALAAPAFAQGGTCPLELEGTWKPQGITEATPTLLAFSADGWVSLLESAAEARAQDFDVAAQAEYRLNVSPSATRIAFESGRGNDIFPGGMSSWEVDEYSDSSMTILNRESGERSYWVRVQTHRYFLTLAPAFAMFTTLDGRSTGLDALGVYPAATFGRIPRALAAELASERDDDRRAMLRIELNEAEYRRAHAVFASWEERARGGITDFIGEMIAPLNVCGPAIALPEASEAASATAFIQRLKFMNRSRHVSDGEFPTLWQPPPAI